MTDDDSSRPAEGARDARRPSSNGSRGAGGARQNSSSSRGATRSSRSGGSRSTGDGERKPYRGSGDGERKPYRGSGDGERKPYAPKAGGTGRAPRAGERPRTGDRAARPYAKKHEKPTSEGRHRDGGERVEAAPAIPDDVTARDLAPAARNELKTLSKENAEQVARHLAMAAGLIDTEPALAHEHALAAVKRAGRIAVVRETAAITAYAIGDFALALRELRTYRRISGKDDQIALLVDSERGVGRPDRALEAGRAVDRAVLGPAVRAELAIAMSGAHLDLGDPERALSELDIPELDPDRAFEWSPALFAARAAVLEELGREAEALEWHRRAEIAAEALDAAAGVAESEELVVEDIAPDEDPSGVDGDVGGMPDTDATAASDAGLENGRPSV